jgi:hypothetical protein
MERVRLEFSGLLNGQTENGSCAASSKPSTKNENSL